MYIEHPYFYEGKYYANIDGEMIEITKENAKVQEQTEPERAEAERVEAEIVYSPMVAEPQEYQYNADAFENYLRDNAANDNKNKEIIMQKDKNVR